MGKSVTRGTLHVLLSLSLLACATPQKPDPVADYCSAVAAEMQKCESIFDGSTTNEALKGECIAVHETLEPKLQAALNSLPDNSVSRLTLSVLDVSVNTYFLVHSLAPFNKAGQSERRADADGIIKDCNDFAVDHR